MESRRKGTLKGNKTRKIRRRRRRRRRRKVENLISAGNFSHDIPCHGPGYKYVLLSEIIAGRNIPSSVERIFGALCLVRVFLVAEEEEEVMFHSAHCQRCIHYISNDFSGSIFISVFRRLFFIIFRHTVNSLQSSYYHYCYYYYYYY
jgi:hypothetical protein